MRIVLDTSAFYHPKALRALAREAADIVVPAVAFTERAREISRDGRMTPEEFLRELRRNHMVVEPYGPEEAVRHAVRVHADARWRRVARDAMIAGHVREGDVLWTANRRDFEDIGVAPAQIRDVTSIEPA